jgi:hypothetical protein
MNLLGLINLLGTLALLFGIAIGITSQEQARRRLFDRFLAWHVYLSVGFAVLAVLHEQTIILFVMPGFVAYLISKACLMDAMLWTHWRQPVLNASTKLISASLL